MSSGRFKLAGPVFAAHVPAETGKAQANRHPNVAVKSRRNPLRIFIITSLCLLSRFFAQTPYSKVTSTSTSPLPSFKALMALPRIAP